MANICSFCMCVKGNHDNIINFYNAMSQKGNVWMGRGAAADIQWEDDGNKAFIDGWCKWSIQSAMIDNAISMRTESDKWYFEDADITTLEFVTLPEACKKWNITMEVYSEEPGCCFQEHFLIDKENTIIDECVEWNEYYIEDFETKEEAETELGIAIMDSEWDNNDEYITRGGFKNWNFEI